MMQHIPHFGTINVDRIISVSQSPPRWSFKSDRRIVRPYIFWGKPRIERGWSYLNPATVNLRIGAEEYIMVSFKPGEVEQAYRDVKAAVLDAQAGVRAETIVSAAVMRTEPNRAGEGTVGMVYSLPRPARHHHILHAMPEMGRSPSRSMQGFLTSTGRFVGRRQARVIAIRAGQVEPNGIAELFSEDLW